MDITLNVHIDNRQLNDVCKLISDLLGVKKAEYDIAEDRLTATIDAQTLFRLQKCDEVEKLPCEKETIPTDIPDSPSSAKEVPDPAPKRPTRKHVHEDTTCKFCGSTVTGNNKSFRYCNRCREEFPSIAAKQRVARALAKGKTIGECVKLFGAKSGTKPASTDGEAATDSASEGDGRVTPES